MEKDRELISLRNDTQSLQRANSTVQLQIQTKDSTINSLQSENQELKLKIIPFQTENQSLIHRNDEYKQQVKAKDNKINLLESEKRKCHTAAIEQTQILNVLKQEKKMVEQEKNNTVYENERLRTSYKTLEQLLKAKEDVTISLNRENQMLSTTNQGNEQGENAIVETLQSLLQSKTNEMELLRQNMDHVLDKEKEKIKKLQKEIKLLKQNQHHQIISSREANYSSHTTVPGATTSNTGTNKDYPSNDINYDTEYGTGSSGSGDTFDEDGENANDLNYDSDD